MHITDGILNAPMMAGTTALAAAGIADFRKMLHHVEDTSAVLRSVRGLLYDEWVGNTRTRVAELSDGKLGYLHIRGMGAANVREFERDLYAVAHGRDGLLIDRLGWRSPFLVLGMACLGLMYLR